MYIESVLISKGALCKINYFHAVRICEYQSEFLIEQTWESNQANVINIHSNWNLIHIDILITFYYMVI